MTDTLKIAVAQVNPTVGAVWSNLDKVRAARARAAEQGADLVIFSELVLNGYPPEDLMLKPAFQDDIDEALRRLKRETADGGPALLIGASCRDEDEPAEGKGRPFNAVLLIENGEITARRFKYDLPNYGVFDEKRIFRQGPLPGPMNFRGVRLGAMVCEDMWTEEVCECLAETGAEILVVINGSPFEENKVEIRENIAVARVTETGLPLIYVNQVGAQDELVFDGTSFVLNADRRVGARMVGWEEDVALTTWQREAAGWSCIEGPRERYAEGLEAIYRAMVLGLRDYVNKNRFPGVVIGLSGGVDSALTAAVAVDALGPERVRCVMMPSRYTSQASLDDAAGCAELLGVHYDIIAIGDAVAAYDGMLADVFKDLEPDTTEENIQARIRAIILMALSNKFGDMVVTTGNKSEMSVGYATLYGDMSGGYSVLKDVYKTTAYALCEWRNATLPDGMLGPEGRVIPQNIITKPPTAELKENQTDQDSLPEYDVLDDILYSLVEKEEGVDEIVARGYDRDTVARIEHLLYVAEYKRRQSPPGVKITSRNFGRDRRYPITNGFRDARPAPAHHEFDDLPAGDGASDSKAAGKAAGDAGE